MVFLRKVFFSLTIVFGFFSILFVRDLKLPGVYDSGKDAGIAHADAPSCGSGGDAVIFGGDAPPGDAGGDCGCGGGSGTGGGGGGADGG